MSKVIKRFRDKNTKKIYNVGEQYDGTEARVKELQEKGFLEKPKKAPPKKVDKK